MKKYYILICFFFFLEIVTVRAQYQVLHNFIDSGATGNANGQFPTNNDLIVSGSIIYGITEDGGASDNGTIFSIDTNGTGYKDLWDFDDTGINGAEPFGSLILSGNIFYGVTLVGGVNQVGNIFSINTNGTGYKDLLDFNSTGTNPFKPVGTLVLSGGVFYGMTNSGGANESGTVFSVNMNGTGFKDLLDFGGLVATGEDPNGNSLTLSASGKVLYGMTPDGGPLYGDGTIFSIHTDGRGYKELLDFNDTDGADPGGYLTLSGKKLYGMTNKGGKYDSGCIFSLDTDGSEYKVLFNFNGINGGYPESSFILSGNSLYGMTSEVGIGYGTIFSIDTDGSSFRIIYNFKDSDGANPWSDLTLSGNVFYGMTQNGGQNNNGVIFKIDTNSKTSIEQLAAMKGGVSLYPNPNNGKFNIAISDKGQVTSEIQVYNELGEKISQFTISNSQTTLDLSDQPNGVYLYRMITQDGNLVGEGKIIIQK